MLYKNKLLLIFLFFCFALNICKAKDSTLVFRTSLGISYTQLKMQQKNFSAQTEYMQYYKADTSLKLIGTKGISPIIKTSINKLFTKKIGIEIGVSYCFSSVEYRTYYTTPFIFTNTYTSPGNPIYQGYSSENNTLLWTHNITLSVGPTFYNHKVYIKPQLNLNYIIYNSTTERTQSSIIKVVSGSASADYPSTTETTNSTKEQRIRLSGGFIVGYDFKIKKLKTFVELGGNFQNDYQDTVRNIFSTFLTFGIKL